MAAVAESSFPLLCQIKSHHRRVNSSLVRVSSPDFASGSFSFRGLSFVLGHRWKCVKRFEATGPDFSETASEDEQEDAIQATIEKSKKVLDMQRNVLKQIAERRKLVSSIKESTSDLDDGKASTKEEEYDSSVIVNTDATKMDGDVNGSVSSSSNGKSSLNKEPEAKSLSPSTGSMKESKQSSPQKQSGMGNLGLA